MARTGSGKAARTAAAALAAVLGAGAGLPARADDEAESRRNWFDDPFVQVTAGLPGCPVPPGPLMTREQMRAEAHDRAQRGTSCFQAGRCRLPNAYLYDREIIPRVRQAVLVDGRFTDTSIWALGQRRAVWLQGCVRSAAQALAVEQLVRQIDDVEAVVNQLQLVAPP